MKEADPLRDAYRMEELELLTDTVAREMYNYSWLPLSTVYRTGRHADGVRARMLFISSMYLCGVTVTELATMLEKSVQAISHIVRLCRTTLLGDEARSIADLALAQIPSLENWREDIDHFTKQHIFLSCDSILVAYNLNFESIRPILEYIKIQIGLPTTPYEYLTGLKLLASFGALRRDICKVLDKGAVQEYNQIIEGQARFYKYPIEPLPSVEKETPPWIGTPLLLSHWKRSYPQYSL